MITFFQNLALFSIKNANFFAKIFGENILKILEILEILELGCERAPIEALRSSFLLSHCICKEMPFTPVDRVVDMKKIIGKMEGRGGEEAQGVADPKKCTWSE
jgi:hypothetical protein